MNAARTVLFLFFSITILASIAAAQTYNQGHLSVKETSFDCGGINFGVPGSTITCTASYQVIDSGLVGPYARSDVTLEACIQPKTGWTAALISPVEFSGQCVPGETFCNKVQIVGSCYNGLCDMQNGDTFTAKFNMIVPTSGQKTITGANAFVGYGNLYSITKTSVDSCCYNPDGTSRPCSALQPYGFNTVFSTFSINDPSTLDSDGDGVPDSIDKCPGTPHDTHVDSTGCPSKVWEICIDSTGKYTCAGSADLNLILYALPTFERDTIVQSICKSQGLTGTGNGYWTQQACLGNASISQAQVTKWERCSDGSCESKSVIPDAQTYIICDAAGKTGTGPPYYDSASACQSAGNCTGTTYCSDGKTPTFYCSGGIKQATGLTCPGPTPSGKLACGTVLPDKCQTTNILGAHVTGIDSRCDTGWCLEMSPAGASSYQGYCAPTNWTFSTLKLHAGQIYTDTGVQLGNINLLASEPLPVSASDLQNVAVDLCKISGNTPPAPCGANGCGPVGTSDCGKNPKQGLTQVCGQTWKWGEQSGPVASTVCQTGWCIDLPRYGVNNPVQYCSPSNWDRTTASTVLTNLIAAAPNPAAATNLKDGGYNSAEFLSAMCSQNATPPMPVPKPGPNEVQGCAGGAPNGVINPGETCANCADENCLPSEKCVNLTQDQLKEQLEAKSWFGMGAYAAACSAGFLAGAGAGATTVGTGTLIAGTATTGVGGAALAVPAALVGGIGGGLLGCATGIGGTSFVNAAINRVSGADAQNIAAQLIEKHAPAADCVSLQTGKAVFEIPNHWCNVDNDCLQSGAKGEDLVCNKKIHRCETPGAFNFLNDWAASIEAALGIKGSGYIVLGVGGLLVFVLLFKLLEQPPRRNA